MHRPDRERQSHERDNHQRQQQALRARRRRRSQSALLDGRSALLRARSASINPRARRRGTQAEGAAIPIALALNSPAWTRSLRSHSSSRRSPHSTRLLRRARCASNMRATSRFSTYALTIAPGASSVSITSGARSVRSHSSTGGDSPIFRRVASPLNPRAAHEHPQNPLPSPRAPSCRAAAAPRSPTAARPGRGSASPAPRPSTRRPTCAGTVQTESSAYPNSRSTPAPSGGSSAAYGLCSPSKSRSSFVYSPLAPPATGGLARAACSPGSPRTPAPRARAAAS